MTDNGSLSFNSPGIPSADDSPDESCGDLVHGYDEDGRTTYECGAPLHHTPTGYHCGKGHAYTYAAARHDQGWDYADDPVEAQLLAQAGVIGVPPGSASG